MSYLQLHCNLHSFRKCSSHYLGSNQRSKCFARLMMSIDNWLHSNKRNPLGKKNFCSWFHEHNFVNKFWCCQHYILGSQLPRKTYFPSCKFGGNLEKSEICLGCIPIWMYVVIQWPKSIQSFSKIKRLNIDRNWHSEILDLVVKKC